MHEKKAVSIVGCDDYQSDNVFKSVSEAIALLGGMDKFVSKGDKVVIKPNLLRASPIEKGVTTHPEVVKSVCKLLMDNGCELLIADSPGGGTPFSERSLRKSYAAAGLDKVAKDLGIELNFDLGYVSVSAKDSRLIKRFSIIKQVIDADAIVNVCKLKTHLFTYMTGATKNTFGVIPGMEKATFHSRLQNPDDFAEMLVDLNELVKPRLNVMDAVVGMEGNGPNSGKTVRMKVILASNNYAAMDIVACLLMQIPPMEVGVIKSAVSRGILSEDMNDVILLGGKIEDYSKKFKIPQTYLTDTHSQGALWRALASMARAYAIRPTMVKEKCKGISNCGECYKICPEKAIISQTDRPKVDYGKCIRCYCCHEICPEDAIKLERSFSGKMMKGLVDRRSKEIHNR